MISYGERSLSSALSWHFLTSFPLLPAMS
jgi:hypothetical protein